MSAAKTICSSCGAPMYPDRRPPVVCTLCRESIGDEEADRLVAADELQERLDEETKPYGRRSLVVRHVHERGWAVYDRDGGQKMRPLAPHTWFRKRSTAIAALATEVVPA